MNDYEKEITAMMKTPIGNGKVAIKAVNPNDPFGVTNMMKATIGGCYGCDDPDSLLICRNKGGTLVCQP